MGWPQSGSWSWFPGFSRLGLGPALLQNGPKTEASQSFAHHMRMQSWRVISNTDPEVPLWNRSLALGTARRGNGGLVLLWTQQKMSGQRNERTSKFHGPGGMFIDLSKTQQLQVTAPKNPQRIQDDQGSTTTQASNWEPWRRPSRVHRSN